MHRLEQRRRDRVIPPGLRVHRKLQILAALAVAVGGVLGVQPRQRELDAPAGAELPFSADRLPQLAEGIARYMRRHGKSHIGFSEFVLLCRHVAP